MMVLGTKKFYPKSLVVLFLIFQNILHSQTLNFGHLSVEEGLSNSYVNCLLQDRTGFIWFGTDDGLDRFDGYEIKIYRNDPSDSSSIANNIIWALYEDNDGFLWIGTKSGILDRYNPLTEKFEHWYLDSTRTKDINITFITEDSKKNLWIGTYKSGVFKFNRSKNTFVQWINKSEEQKVLTDNFIISILEDNFSNVWVSTYYGLNKYNPGSESVPFEMIKNNLFNEPLWYLGKSSFYNNSIWIGKLNGLINFNPQTLECNEIDLSKSYGLQYGNSVSSVVEEKFEGEKILWVGTYGGLIRINLTTGYKERFIQNKIVSSGMLSNQINDLIIDESGVVWIGTDNGLNFYSPKRAKFNFPIGQNASFLKYDEIKNGNIRSVYQTNKSNFWFGTEKGLFGLKITDSQSSLISNSQLEELNVWSMSIGKSDNLWIGTYGQGLKELNLKTNQIKTWKVENPDFYPSAYYYVKAIIQDDEGMVWIGFWGGGLARLNPINGKIDYWRYQPEISGSLSYNDIWAIHQDRKGRMWIGTNGGGLDLFYEEQNNFITWKSSSNSESVLSSNSIYTIYESSNKNESDEKTILWIGTSKGLNKFVISEGVKNVNGSKINIENTIYTVDNGLSDNSIESILEDENGNLWIGTSSGISLFNIEDETFKNFSTADGLSSGASNSNAAFASENGLMIFGATTGINVFDPKRVLQSNYSPPVVITEFQLFNQPGDEASTLKESIIYTKDIKLSYNQNDFSFQFASLDYNAPELNQYAYFMAGFDDDWIHSGKRRFVTYTNLDPGEYVFQVKATNSDGLWSSNIAEIFIVINPPFWSTWWAYSIYIIAFIGGLYLIRNAETKRRKRKEEERLRKEREEALLREAELKAKNIEHEKELEKHKIRNRIAQDLHDEIGSNLSSISLMSELVQKDGKINPDVLAKINRIQKVAKGSSQAMRDIVWLTNPSSDNIKDLVSKMNEVANDMLGGLKWNFNFPRDLNEITLTPEIKRNVFFIYKESLNNIVKHSGAKNVYINLSEMNDQIILKISDDGKGFNTNAVSTGNGLKNILNRAKEIGGKLELNSNPGKGTELLLEVNITQLRD